MVILALALTGTGDANAAGLSSLASSAASPSSASDAGSPNASDCLAEDAGSPFIPVDSWVYPAMLRLYSLGFLDHVFLNMRPWTRASIGPMLRDVNNHLEKEDRPSSASEEAERIFDSLVDELHFDRQKDCLIDDGNTRFESAYSTVRAISGTPLRDSYHLGSTIINDYGRPYAHGFNNYTGLSGYASRGRYLLYVRGEFQGAPSATGYSTALAEELSNLDQINFINPATGLPYYQATIPLGPIGATARMRLLEAYVSATVFNHVVSFGKVDEWISPAQGGAMAYSNNAESIYAFRINRVEPLRVPGLSKITGPFRYEFLVGPLHGHTEIAPTVSSWVNPGDPWLHVEKVSFRPTSNLEMALSGPSSGVAKGTNQLLCTHFSEASSAPRLPRMYR